jgi:hypothetical protein
VNKLHKYKNHELTITDIVTATATTTATATATTTTTITTTTTTTATTTATTNSNTSGVLQKGIWVGLVMETMESRTTLKRIYFKLPLIDIMSK